jgi:hypothetical protein
MNALLRIWHPDGRLAGGQLQKIINLSETFSNAKLFMSDPFGK